MLAVAPTPTPLPSHFDFGRFSESFVFLLAAILYIVEFILARLREGKAKERPVKERPPRAWLWFVSWRMVFVILGLIATGLTLVSRVRWFAFAGLVVTVLTYEWLDRRSKKDWTKIPYGKTRLTRSEETPGRKTTEWMETTRGRTGELSQHADALIEAPPSQVGKADLHLEVPGGKRFVDGPWAGAIIQWEQETRWSGGEVAGVPVQSQTMTFLPLHVTNKASTEARKVRAEVRDVQPQPIAFKPELLQWRRARGQRYEVSISPDGGLETICVVELNMNNGRTLWSPWNEWVRNRGEEFDIEIVVWGENADPQRCHLKVSGLLSGDPAMSLREEDPPVQPSEWLEPTAKQQVAPMARYRQLPDGSIETQLRNAPTMGLLTSLLCELDIPSADKPINLGEWRGSLWGGHLTYTATYSPAAGKPLEDGPYVVRWIHRGAIGFSETRATFRIKDGRLGQ